jgi:hypothetical protein
LVAVVADNPPKLNPLPLGAFFLFDVDDEDDDVSSPPPPPPLRLNNPPPNAGAGGVVAATGADGPPKLNPVEVFGAVVVVVEGLANPPPNAWAGGVVVAAAGADGPPKLNPVEVLGAVVVEGLAEAGAAPPKLNPTLGAASLPVDDDEKENPDGGLVVVAGAGAPPKLKAIVGYLVVVLCVF